MKETGISKNKKADGTGVTDKLYLVLRIAVLFAVLFMFIPGINPARISGMIGRNLSLFTSGISYSSLASEFGRAFRKGWVMKSTLRLDSVSALIICVGTAAVASGGCFPTRRSSDLGLTLYLLWLPVLEQQRLQREDVYHLVI